MAERLSYSRAHVANTIRLLSLPPDVQRLLALGRIQAGHARALLSLPDEEAQSAVALRIAGEGLSVRQVEELVKTYATAGRPRPARLSRPVDPSVLEVQEVMSDRLGTTVRVTLGKRKGRVVIEFGTRDDLDRIASVIGRGSATELGP